MMATTSPSRADSETPFSTCSWPNFLCRFSIWIASAAASRSISAVATVLACPAFGHLRCLVASGSVLVITLSHSTHSSQDGPPGAHPSTGPCPACGERRQMVSDVAQICAEERDDHPGRQVVRRTVDGGAAEARADALGGKCDAARGPSRVALRPGLRSGRVPASSTRPSPSLSPLRAPRSNGCPTPMTGCRIRSSHTTRR